MCQRVSQGYSTQRAENYSVIIEKIIMIDFIPELKNVYFDSC